MSPSVLVRTELASSTVERPRDVARGSRPRLSDFDYIQDMRIIIRRFEIMPSGLLLLFRRLTR